MVDINNVGISNFPINRLGGLIKTLEKLVDLNKIKKFIDKKDNFNEFSKYIKSYEFCICFCLNQTVEILRDDPKFLDLKEDLLFIRAYNSVIPRTKFPTNTELCNLANNIFGLIDLIFKAETYEKLREAIPNVIKYILTPIKEVFYNNFELANKYKDLNKDIVLSRLAKSYFHIVFHDGKKIRAAYDSIVKKGQIYRAQLNETIFKELKKKDYLSVQKSDSVKDIAELFKSVNFNRVGDMQENLGDQLFFEGYKLIIDYLWNELFKNPFSEYEFLNKIIFSKDWEEFDHYFEKIRDEIITPLENRNEAIDITFKSIFVKQNRILNETLKLLTEKILFSVKRTDLTDNERLDRSFLCYEVKLVNSYASIPCANEFILIFMGLMQFNDEFIKIIRFKHPGNSYSYAIFVEGPTYSFFLNYASWYVFLDFATDHSGEGGTDKKSVDEYINQFESQIHLSEHKIDSEVLKEYIKDKEIKNLSKKIRKLEDYKAEAKGIILELVNAYFFSKLGYQVHWALKEKFTNGTEIDLLVFRKFRKMVILYVIEITTTTEQNLYEEVKRKIEILQENSSKLLKFLNLEKQMNCKFRGIAISDIKTNLQADEMVKIINFKDVINNLKNVKIELKKRLIKILEI